MIQIRGVVACTECFAAQADVLGWPDGYGGVEWQLPSNWRGCGSAHICPACGKALLAKTKVRTARIVEAALRNIARRNMAREKVAAKAERRTTRI